MVDETTLLKRIATLEASVGELAALNQIATAIGSSMSLDEINQRIVQMVVKRVRASQGAVFLLPEKDDAQLQTMIRVQERADTGGPARLGEVATGWIIKNQRPLNISRDSDTEGFIGHMPGAVDSALSVPLRSSGRVIGTLSVFNKQGEDSFNESDQRFLSIVAAQSVQVIDKIRSLEVEKSLSKIKSELSVAKDIQTAFMPRSFPELSQYDLYALNIQADEVGGDSFDVVTLGADKLLVSLGDVCGHGVPAALLMAMAQTAIRSQVEALEGGIENLASFIGRISGYIFRNSERNRFMTMLIGVLDTKSHTFEYVRAGHPPGILCDGSHVSLLENGGMPLGVIPEVTYESDTVEVPSGSRLLLFSDGVTELENTNSEQYGERRLQAFAGERFDGSSEKFCELLALELTDFHGEAPQEDDITLLTFRRL